MSHLNRQRSTPPWLDRLRRLIQHGDRPWQWLMLGMAGLVLILMLAIGWLLWQSSPLARAQFGWAFLLPTSDASWNPVSGKFESWPFIYGTLLTSLVAIVLSVP